VSHSLGLEAPVSALIEDYAPQKVLDVGCGCGSWYPALPFDCEWVGIDMWLPYLCQQRFQSRDLVRGSATKLPFHRRTFCIVLCIEILEHLSRDDGARMLKEAKRVAKRAVVVTTPTDPLGRHSQGQINRNPHERHITATSSRRLVSLGFNVHKIRTSDEKWDEFLIGVYEVDC
jgi:ubiquinone/menaquinone biosynthesis C-methylase UbiE